MPTSRRKRSYILGVVKGFFLGYDKLSPAYLVYFPETGKVMKHRVVKFPSKSVNEKQEVCYVMKMISCCYGVALTLICAVHLMLTGLRKS